MQAIIAKFLPATNFKPSRIKASCDRGSLTISYDCSGLGSDSAFRSAVDQLCARFDAEDEKRRGVKPDLLSSWSRPKVSGQIPSGEWVFCFAPVKTAEPMPAGAFWHWPDRVIGKRESRRLREEHNALANKLAEVSS